MLQLRAGDSGAHVAGQGGSGGPADSSLSALAPREQPFAGAKGDFGPARRQGRNTKTGATGSYRAPVDRLSRTGAGDGSFVSRLFSEYGIEGCRRRCPGHPDEADRGKERLVLGERPLFSLGIKQHAQVLHDSPARAGLV